MCWQCHRQNAQISFDVCMFLFCGVANIAAKPVTVGWGKKETQFHGSEGKPKPGDIQKKASRRRNPGEGV